ncbi:MAG: DUF4080 domain-containing protein [Myxococcales bacterium]|nr:DUF4080 domain-containing protein [Myxococcales bacterium]
MTHEPTRAPEALPRHDIVLTTFNARFIHCAFGLRYLLANLGPLRERATIRESVLGTRPADLAEQLLSESPRLVGISVYIWNVRESLELLRILKRIQPSLVVVVGGPEVSHELEDSPFAREADAVITGDGEHAFATLCADVLRDGAWQGPRVIAGGKLAMDDLVLPYDEYTDDDLAHRVVYVEASRGCPFRCEFCLSSLDKGVRPGRLDRLFTAFDRLLLRGLRQFKFVDRTFNIDVETSAAILDYFLGHLRRLEGAEGSEGREGGAPLFLHFEMIPDRLPDALRERLRVFPPGSLQLEVGVQTWDPAVSKRISRVQNPARLQDNFRFLRNETHAHVHADLIVGLPGETLASFAVGFDALFALGPDEIQVGILKRLKGAPIARHEHEFQLVFAPEPPFEVLSTSTLTFADVQFLRRFAQVHDQAVNRGHFPRATALLFGGAASAFERVDALTRFVERELGRTHAVALGPLADVLYRFLTCELALAPEVVGPALCEDYVAGGKRGLTPFLQTVPGGAAARVVAPGSARSATPSRQERHATRE